MKTKPDSGAFACVALSDDGRKTWQDGLSKREYIAALALQGLLANKFRMTNDEAAKDALNYTDALIKELNKEKKDVL